MCLLYMKSEQSLGRSLTPPEDALIKLFEFVENRPVF